MTPTLYELIQKPYAQVLFGLILTTLSIFVIRPKNPDRTWARAGIVYIGFILTNSLLLFIIEDSWTYILCSLGFSVLYLFLIAMLIPATLKILKLEGSAESAMVFIFIIYHPVLMVMVLFLKWIYSLF